ncbi:MAG TPA: hypothetical protein ENJ64_04690 [Thiotrichales bacterium]|nr:hypothetical protein [Thiotrichales bacterium]
MEFFEEIRLAPPAAPKTTIPTPDASTLKRALRIKDLPLYCASIDTVLADNGDSGVIYCLWGEFRVNREEIRYGLRFSLPNCPNALAWTITANDESIVVHCTIDKQSHDEDFIESIRLFMQDWAQGIKKIAA